MKLDLLGHTITVHEITEMEAKHNHAVLRDGTGTGYESVIKDEKLLAKIGECIGAASKPSSNIILDNDLPETLKVDTLIHECIHLIKYFSMAEDKFLSEAQIQLVALGMFNLLARNHHLMDWIKENTKDLDRSKELASPKSANDVKISENKINQYLCSICHDPIEMKTIKYSATRSLKNGTVVNEVYCSESCQNEALHKVSNEQG